MPFELVHNQAGNVQDKGWVQLLTRRTTNAWFSPAVAAAAAAAAVPQIAIVGA